MQIKSLETVSRGNKTIRKIVVLLLFTIIEGLLVYSESQYVMPFTITAMLLSLLWDKNFTVVMYISVSLLHVDLSTIGNLFCFVVIGAIIFSYLSQEKLRNLKEYKRAVVFFSIIAIFSFFGAIESTVISVALIIFQWFLVLYIAQLVCDNRYQLIVYAIVAVGITMLLMVLVLPNTGDVVYAYQGNKKAFSTVLGAAMYFVFSSLLYRKIKGTICKIMAIVLLLLLAFTTIYTYSRGVLIAVSVSALFLFVSLKRSKRIIPLLVGSIIVLVAYYFFPIRIDNEQMFDHIEGGNGRTEIWLYFYEAMKSQGIWRLLFGCGTMGLEKLTITGIYAHSAILDYFFSFGILGFSFIIYILTTIMLSLKKNKNYIFAGLLIFTILMFSTHGASNDNLFLLLLGLCMGGTCLSSQVLLNKNLK